MLKIQFQDKRSEARWIVERQFVIGRNSNNHLVIIDPSISPVHAKLITKDQKLFLKDNNSDTGCFVNGQRVTQKEVIPGDVIRLGSIDLDILDPRASASQPVLTESQSPQQLWSLVADSSWLSGQEFKVHDTQAIVGRGSQCDIVIPGTHLSRQHAEIIVEENRLAIRDLGSANGTFVNDERISQGFLRAGDRLRLDVYSFRVVGPGDANKTRLRQPPPTPSGTKTSAVNADNSNEKRWKTRPTSEGNRVEIEAIKKPFSLGLISGILLFILLGYIVYLIIQGQM